MTDDTRQPKKRGPKPLGDAPMTSAERQRRRRNLARERGAKSYLIQIEGLHQQWIGALAKRQGITDAAALHQLLEAALDRYTGIMQRCERLQNMGATDEQIALFVETHFFPRLPSLDNLEVPKLN